MRRAQLHEVVTELVEETWAGVDRDVAEAVLADEDGFGALCHRLHEASDGSAESIEKAWDAVVEGLSDAQLDWLAADADAPGAFLASRVG